MIAGASLLTALLLAQTMRQQRAQASALAERLQEGAVLARRVRNQRAPLARSLAALGRQQALVLDGLLPELCGALGEVENLDLEEAADPRLPVVSGRYWRRVVPAARARGLAGVRPGVAAWLAGGAVPAAALGIGLGPGARALLGGRPGACAGVDLVALAKLEAEMRALSSKAAQAHRALAGLSREGRRELSALRLVLGQNVDYRSLSEFALPGAARSARQQVRDCVRLAQTLALVSTTPVRLVWAGAPAPAPAAPAPRRGWAGVVRYCTNFRPIRRAAGA